MRKTTLSDAVLCQAMRTLAATRKGQLHPSGPSLKLLNLLDRKGLEAVL